VFKPVFDEINTDKYGFSHIKMIKEVFQFWKSEKPQIMKQFQQKNLTNLVYMKKLLEKAFKDLPKLELAEFVEMLIQFIDPASDTIFVK
jgi:hypothetical protein